jgi:hypothetical protein
MGMGMTAVSMPEGIAGIFTDGDPRCCSNARHRRNGRAQRHDAHSANYRS